MSDLLQPDAPNPGESALNGRTLRDQQHPRDSSSEGDESPIVFSEDELPSADQGERRKSGGPRLTVAQRQIVLQVIAEYGNIGMVMLVLRSEYPEIPQVSDRTLRDYRAGKRGAIAALVPTINRDVLTTGLAQRKQRIRHLIYQYNRLMSRQAAADQRALDENRAIDPQLKIVAQMCELLKQIAIEAGDRPTNRTAVAQRGWFYEEFGQKLSSMMRENGMMSDFRGLFRKLDDCPLIYRYETIGRGAYIIERPYVSLLANLTPADLEPYARRGAALWGDGFFARFAFVVPPFVVPSADMQVSTARFPRGERIIPSDLIGPLRAWHDRLGIPVINISERTNQMGASTGIFDVGSEPPGPQHCMLADGVEDCFYNYHNALMTMASESKLHDLDGNYARFAEKALRVAMLLASVENDGRIELRHWACAQGIAEQWRCDLHTLIDSLKGDNQANHERANEDRILKVLQAGISLSARDIGRAMHIDSGDTEQILSRLVRQGEVLKIPTKRTVLYQLSGIEPQAAATPVNLQLPILSPSQVSPVTSVTTNPDPVTVLLLEPLSLTESDEAELTEAIIGAEAEPAQLKADTILPIGWRLERCDHTGYLSQYGTYWLATDGSNQTEPTMYQDSAAFAARAAAQTIIEKS